VTFSHVHGDGPESEAGFDDKPRSYPTSSRAAYDFVYCFDVMVHMDLHAMFRCLKRIRESKACIYRNTRPSQAR